jgi:S1-C subfamily serine protease
MRFAFIIGLIIIFGLNTAWAEDDKIDGIEVMKVVAGSQSETIGTEIVDIIAKYNGEAVRTPQELYNQILQNTHREKIEMVVYRDRNLMIFSVKGGKLGLGVKYIKDDAD